MKLLNIFLWKINLFISIFSLFFFLGIKDRNSHSQAVTLKTIYSTTTEYDKSPYKNGVTAKMALFGPPFSLSHFNIIFSYLSPLCHRPKCNEHFFRKVH